MFSGALKEFVSSRLEDPYKVLVVVPDALGKIMFISHAGNRTPDTHEE